MKPNRTNRPGREPNVSSTRAKWGTMIDTLTRYAALDVREIGRVHAELWQEHVTNNKQLVLDAAQLTENKECCVIIGAGPCYDIPLLELAQMFVRVELLDLNPASLAQAVADLPEYVAQRVVCRAVEITHALPGALHEIKQEFAKAGTRAQRAANKAVSILDGQNVGLGELANIRGDLIISDMILSQLPTSLWLVDEWYTQSFHKTITDDASWLRAMAVYKEKLQNAHIEGLLSKKNSVVVLATDFGVASSVEEATLQSALLHHRMTLADSTLQTIAKIRADANVDRTWIWQRDASPPKFSPVCGLVFRPENLS